MVSIDEQVAVLTRGAIVRRGKNQFVRVIVR